MMTAAQALNACDKGLQVTLQDKGLQVTLQDKETMRVVLVISPVEASGSQLEFVRNLVAHGDAREGK